MQLGQQLMALLEQYRGASPANAPASAESDYAQVAQQIPQSHLASGLAEAFRSNDTPSFGEMLGSLFGKSDPQQRAGILNQLLSTMGPGLLASGGLGSLAGLLGGQQQLTPQQASQVSPETVQQLAEHAKAQRPSIVDEASQFYAQHPKLIQALGAGSLALIMSHISNRK